MPFYIYALCFDVSSSQKWPSPPFQHPLHLPLAHMVQDAKTNLMTSFFLPHSWVMSPGPNPSRSNFSHYRHPSLILVTSWLLFQCIVELNGSWFKKVCKQVRFWILEFGKMGLWKARGAKDIAMSNKRALHPWEGRDDEQLVTYITIKCKLSWVIRKKYTGFGGSLQKSLEELIAFLTGR